MIQVGEGLRPLVWSVFLGCFVGSARGHLSGCWNGLPFGVDACSTRPPVLRLDRIIVSFSRGN